MTDAYFTDPSEANELDRRRASGHTDAAVSEAADRMDQPEAKRLSVLKGTPVPSTRSVQIRHLIHPSAKFGRDSSELLKRRRGGGPLGRQCGWSSW